MKKLLIAKANADRILGIEKTVPAHEKEKQILADVIGALRKTGHNGGIVCRTQARALQNIALFIQIASAEGGDFTGDCSAVIREAGAQVFGSLFDKQFFSYLN